MSYRKTLFCKQNLNQSQTSIDDYFILFNVANSKLKIKPFLNETDPGILRNAQRQVKYNCFVNFTL